MSNMDRIRQKFLGGEIKYLDAIEVLQDHFGLSPREAEKVVEEWETARAALAQAREG